MLFKLKTVHQILLQLAKFKDPLDISFLKVINLFSA